MLRSGNALRSDNPWASLLHLVPKKEDGWRPCGDYRTLNARTVPDQYPVRHIADFAHQLAGRKGFCTIDLIKAFEKALFQGLPCHIELFFSYLNIAKCELVEVENSMFKGLIMLFQIIFGIWTSLK